jgi:ribosomal protein S13
MTILPKLYIDFNDELKFNTQYQRVFGIGSKNKIYKKFGFTSKALFGIIHIRPSFEYLIEAYTLKEKKVSFPLRQSITDDITKKIIINAYQGIRHKFGLSVRGQRTHSNCRTNKKIFKKYLKTLDIEANKKKKHKNKKDKKKKDNKEMKKDNKKDSKKEKKKK